MYSMKMTCERGIKCVSMHASIVWRITKDISVDRLSWLTKAKCLENDEANNMLKYSN